MGIKRAVIKYQYYELCCLDGERETEENYDLRNWIDKMTREYLDLVDRIQEINGIKGRLEIVDLVHNDEFYTLNFMRLDALSNTYLVKEDEEAEHIDLEEGEYIGKNTVILYDPRTHVAMIQCNRGGYGVYAIQSYINSFNDPEDLCYFRPITCDLNADNCLEGITTKIDVRFSNIGDFPS